MKSLIKLVLPAVAILSLAAFTMADAPNNQPDPPKQVWICHGPGHNLDGSLRGNWYHDYVLHYAEGMPLPNQVTWCVDRGGHLMQVSVRGALRGHTVMLKSRDRIDDYPNRR